ncbi:MAG: hypothetical protein FWF83_02645 [Clostridiales bacterium]|nr:hypothetical protein [Clostridiales bacterium]
MESVDQLYQFPVSALEWAEYAHSWIQCVCYSVAAAIAREKGRKESGALTYPLLACAFLCYALGDLFQNLYIGIFRVYPYEFSAADLSWFGVYVCFVVICIHLHDGYSEAERQAVKSYMPVSWAASLCIVLPSHAYMVYAAGQFVNNLFYGLSFLFVLGYSLPPLLAAIYKGVHREAIPYHAWVSAFTGVEVAMFLASCFWDSPIYNLYYFFNAVMTCMPFAILSAAKKGAARC